MRGWLVIGTLVLLAVFAPAPAWQGSARAENPEAGQKAKEGENKEENNIFKGTLDLAIWSVVVFLVLLFVLGKFAWQPMMEGLDKREHAIHSAIEEAKSAREEAARLREQLQAEMDKAHEKVREIMDEARRDAQKLADDLRTKAMADVQTERERLRREIDTAKDQALQDIWNQAANLATLISAQVIGRSLSGDDHRRLVDEALKEVEVIAAQGQGRATEAGQEWVRQAGGKI
jgi:F-type H+-transporting ATPase subunit b